MANPQDKRRFIRLAFPYTVYIKPAKGQEISTYTENISAGGIKVVLHESLPAMDIVSLRVFVRHDPVICKAKVEWIKRVMSEYIEGAQLYEVGLNFVDISAADRKFINERVMTLGFLDKPKV